MTFGSNLNTSDVSVANSFFRSFGCQISLRSQFSSNAYIVSEFKDRFRQCDRFRCIHSRSSLGSQFSSNAFTLSRSQGLVQALSNVSDVLMADSH